MAEAVPDANRQREDRKAFDSRNRRTAGDRCEGDERDKLALGAAQGNAQREAAAVSDGLVTQEQLRRAIRPAGRNVPNASIYIGLMTELIFAQGVLAPEFMIGGSGSFTYPLNAAEQAL